MESTFVYCGEFNPTRFEKPLESGVVGYKPRQGGLYTSPLLPSGKSEWEEWCEGEHYQHHSLCNKRYMVTPKPNAKIHTLESNPDKRRWGLILSCCDAVYIHLPFDGMRSEGWDVVTLFIINLNAFTIAPF